jgi:putative methionine-R-sulfoxide reductase with GAF domain
MLWVAAVIAHVAVVTHHEYLSCGYSYRSEIVQGIIHRLAGMLDIKSAGQLRVEQAGESPQGTVDNSPPF